jgi:hypothetical protein
VAVWLDNEVAPTFNAWRDDLTGLGTPPTGRKVWTQVLTAATRIAQLNASQVDAAKRQDTTAFAQATKALGLMQPDWNVRPRKPDEVCRRARGVVHRMTMPAEDRGLSGHRFECMGH